MKIDKNNGVCYYVSKGVKNMFRKNDTVCFLGDSITTHGHFIKEVFEYLAKNHKEDRVKLFNCGVPGDAAVRTVNRLYEDCLIFNPQKVVLMLGVNDIEPELYLPESDDEDEKKSAIDLYKIKIREIVEKCEQFGAEVILCTPTPVQEERATYKGCNEALGICIEFLKELAEEKDLLFVDYNTTLSQMFDREIMGADGIHPVEYGHHIMAQILLKTLGYIKECDFDTMPEYSDKNIERAKVETKLRHIRMMEWCPLYDFNMEKPDATYEEKIKRAEEIREGAVKDKKQWLVNTAEDYINYFHRVPYLQGELLRKTIEMYE